ncbi:ATP-dependent helicase [Algoriphagus zhangzhouensis]|uniref:DNA 3'-5' helicase n=1 Tax=Algoriphagus zhangzhouensis TaxID=1073327 RepID=A0A1M7Z9N5_9BACT|nr:UvrD-helicase domain-containing protein [Algoriphagus zhangzhouensis]TDY47370.1 DNA helicase-2/ATP-dependent DNA helicase PcrA [Algoriphagus zhangzhouensis]SHO61584.1 DNA helicase-2 / ATP-dependent DNA helicase PcrA [Algoriphagus zhangzhouensis]
MTYLEELNPPQREAVEHTDGPVMIIAGAGSGKTRVLTYRIAHLIYAKGVDPFQILSLTFTNKAAAEMKHRIESLVGLDARNTWMGTFHSVFAKILRVESEKIGYPSNFTIYDTDDSKSLIRTIVKEMHLDDKVYKAGTVLSRISGAKNRLISWQAYLNDPFVKADDEAAMKPKMGEIYQKYQERLFKSGAMDFDDLLFNTNVLFRDHIDVLNKYQQRFKYVMVDEFQDTNLSQYLITKKLAAVHQNICVVGDDAQSIYAFRGADIQNILNFEKDYPDLMVVKLEQNYRSTKTIVDAANSIIDKNQAQLKKTVWTSNPDGDLIELVKATSDNEEGRIVANTIFEEKNLKKLQNSDFAILYRTNSQSRAIEEALRKMNITYKIVGGLSFYQRKEIKDLMAYMRFTVNPVDEEAFKRIINYPKRGIGNTSVEKILVGAYDHDVPLWEVVQNAHSFLPGRAGSSVDDFATMIKAFQIEVERKDAFEAANSIAKQSGLLRELYEDKTIEGLNRYENVQELLNAIKEYVDNEENEDKSLGAFLQEIALLTDNDRDKDTTDSVTLMTIHSSKGLEFNQVFVVGMEEDLFPSQMMMQSREDLEEERRLFYVATTRAMEKLYLTYALTRYRFGRLLNCEPSRFLEEVNPNCIKVSKKKSATREMPGALRKEGLPGSSGFIGIKKKPETRVASTLKVHTPSPDFKPSNTNNLQVEQLVEHPKFGYGKVQKIEVEGLNKKATIQFEHFGEKTLLLSFAKLRIID